MINQLPLSQKPFEHKSDFATGLFDREWEWGLEVSPGSPVTTGNTFTVLPTGASGYFKDWVWPVPVWNGRKPVISNGFDPRPDPKWGMKHGGVDLFYLRLPNEPATLPQGYKRWFVPSNLIPVLAAGKGIVVHVGKTSLGHNVIIDHGNGYHTFYQHLTAQGLPAKSTPVTAGTPIGIVGHGQEFKLNHLHFEIWKGWQPGQKPGRQDPGLILRVPAGVPQVSVSGTVLSQSTATPGPTADALRRGQWAEAIQMAIKNGERDENRLTSMVFFARYPKREGRKLVKGEPGFDALAKEWLLIRDRLVRPSLSGKSAPAAPTPSQEPASIQTSDMPRGRYGILVVETPAQYRFSYIFTPEDALWLARLVKGEAGGRNDLNNHAVIWAMFNRFAFFTHAGSDAMKRAGGQGYPTFSSFVQSYSTTLQPVLHSVKAAQRAIALSQKDPGRFQYIKTGGFYKGTPIPKGQLKHHLERIRKMTWSSLSQETKSMVERALQGVLPNPIGLASEFANTKTYFIQNKKRSPQNYEEWRNYTELFARSQKWTWIGPMSGLDQLGLNAFFLDNRVKSLAKETVRVKPPV
jgi:murein DD-endopeptidase MepM/ murein hydrolase activator NlpD